MARFNSPNGIYASRGGDSLLISDFNTGNIRLISGLVTGLVKESSIELGLDVFPNPSDGQINIRSEHNMQAIEISDLNGKRLLYNESISEIM